VPFLYYPRSTLKQKPNMELVYTGMRRITTFRSTTDRMYDGGLIRL